MDLKETFPHLSKRSLKKLKRKQNKLKEIENKNDFQIKKEENLKNKLEQRTSADLITQKILDETDYYFENGLRKVKPYFFDFVANAKGRWFGKGLVDVFSREFQYYTEDKCKDLILKGSLRVDNQNDTTSLTHIIQNGDIIINTIHRHELPVLSSKIVIVNETDDILVVDKPPSIPIHPCGRYRHNSLLYILAKEHGYFNLRVAHRLDRLTSGLVILCKTEQKTKELMNDIKNRNVRKVYLSKVEGIFPKEPIVCEKAIGVLSPKLGIYRVDGEGGKASRTNFTLVCSDGKTSVVKCEPETGRTHQIRIHLQYLGYPIVNDPTYNHLAWGPHKGKHADYGKSLQQLIAGLSEVHKSSIYINAEDISNNKSNNDKNNNNNDDNKNNKKNNNCDEYNNNKNKDYKDSEIPVKKVKVDEADFKNSVSTDVNRGDDGENEEKSIDNKNSDNNTNKNDDNKDIISIISKNESNDNNKEKKSTDNIKNNKTNHKNNKDDYDSDCDECHVTMKEPIKEEMFICLHALSYEGPTWKYKTEMPLWAQY